MGNKDTATLAPDRRFPACSDERCASSAEQGRDLLEVVHGFLHATFHAGVDMCVPGLLVRVLHENHEGRTPSLSVKVSVLTATVSAMPS